MSLQSIWAPPAQSVPEGSAGEPHGGTAPPGDRTEQSMAMDPTVPAFNPSTTSVQSEDETVPAIEANATASDEFAQTRDQDDLFADDFVPLQTPPVSAEPAEATVPQEWNPASSRGRGRGGRRGGNAGLKPEPSAAQGEGRSNAAPEAPKWEAVRGDRSGTGGVRKAKLTEEELAARMEAIKLKNASLEAAHARAEADEASFREREALARERQKIERQNRQQMNTEREKNRLRKFNAMSGREWDADKPEEGPTLEDRYKRSQYTRGVHGGVASARNRPEPQSEASNDLASASSVGWHDDPAVPIGGGPNMAYSGARGSNRGRARARGRGRAHGRGRDESAPDRTERMNSAINIGTDFPALPAKGTKPSDTPEASADAPKTGGLWATDKSWAQTTPGQSWAEAMDGDATNEEQKRF